MKFFIDTADIKEIVDLAATGMVDGVTTNPTLAAKESRDFKAIIKEICSIIPGSVSAEVVATEHKKMMKEADILRKIAKNVTIKLPLTWDGLKTCKQLTSEGTTVNMTLCFSATQALLAAKAGATYVSPFIGRLDDVGQDGMELIADILQVFENYPELETQVLAASIRHPVHVLQAAKLGAHVATLPPKILRQLLNHPLTDKGLATFLEDWKKTGQVIG